MRLRVAISFVLCLCICQLPLFAQQTATVQRDAQAISLLQQSLVAMGGAQALSLQDCLAIGTAQSFRPDGTSVSFPIVKKSKGTRMVRTEIQQSGGTRVRIVNTGMGAIQTPDGKVRNLFANNLVAERIEHIPALSILSEWQSSNIEVRYIGADTVAGTQVQVIAISLIPTSDPNGAAFYRNTTQTLFYIDQASGLVSKIQYQNFAEKDSNISEKVEVFFTNYRVVSGVQVPFTQSYFADGQLRSTMTLASVAFNVGLSNSEFAVPGGN